MTKEEMDEAKRLTKEEMDEAKRLIEEAYWGSEGGLPRVYELLDKAIKNCAPIGEQSE